MKCLPALTAIAFVALSSQAMANLGETKAQIEARWGEPVEIKGYPDERIYTYQTESFRVRVGFLEGVSQFEHYRHFGDLRHLPPLEEAEIQDFLEKNSLGQKWEREDDRYRLADRSASAYVSTEEGKNRSLYVETEKYTARSLDPKRYERSGETLSFSGVAKLRQVDEVEWLVLSDNGYVLEIPWSTG